MHKLLHEARLLLETSAELEKLRCPSGKEPLMVFGRAVCGKPRPGAQAAAKAPVPSGRRQWKVGNIQTEVNPKTLSRTIPEYKLDIVAGDDGIVSQEDVRQATEVRDALRKGIEKAANLCSFRPPACAGNLGITRNHMPQVMNRSLQDLQRSDDPVDQRKAKAAIAAGADPDSSKSIKDLWLDSLKAKGIKVSEDKIPAGKLRASQAEIKAKKSYTFANAYLNGTWKELPDTPILVAKEKDSRGRDVYTVIDGHHRYAGVLLANPDTKMRVQVINAPIRDVLQAAFDVPGVFRANLQDEIVPESQPLDLARKPGETWKQKTNWYAKGKSGKLGGPFKSKDSATAFAQK